MSDMKALSIRAPWWWFILHGGKDIENRSWPTTYRGPVLVHASKWWSLRDVAEDTETAVRMNRAADGPRGASVSFRDMRDSGGNIVGRVEIIDCVTESRSPWFFGEYGFVLANPVAFDTPIPCKGMLGFFSVPDNVKERLP